MAEIYYGEGRRGMNLRVVATVALISLFSAGEAIEESHSVYTEMAEASVTIELEKRQIREAPSTSPERHTLSGSSETGIDVQGSDGVSSGGDGESSSIRHAWCSGEITGITEACLFDDDEDDDDGEGEDEGGVGVEEVVGQAGVLVESELERLGVVPGRVVVQPGGGEVLVNVGVVFYADVEVQSFSLELLGYEVEVEVEPVWFEWDFGDGSAVVGVEEAGGPFPDHVVSHEYGRSGVYEVGLVTVWDGRFRVVGLSEWVDLGDQPVTEDVFGPLRVVSKTNRLLKTN